MSEKEKVSLGNTIQEQIVPQVYQVPVQAVDLPSRGKVYPVESPLHNKKTLEIRAMTARDEDVLSSRSLLKQGKTMSVLLKNCLIDKSIDPDKMLVGDRNAILIALRASGYGASYETKIECPECQEVFENSFNLGSFPIIELGQEPVQDGVNQFEAKLPMSKSTVMFKLLTGEEEREITVAMEKMKKLSGPGSVDPSVTTRLFHQIISINGETDRSKISRIVKDLPAGDSLKLRNQIDKISPGVSMRSEVVCKACSAETEVDMPMGLNFFWPSS